MSALGNFYYSQTPVMKTIITVLLLLLVAFILLNLYRWYKSYNSTKQFQTDYDQYTSSGQKPTFPQSTYTTLADKIYNSVSKYASFGLGKDTQAVLDAFGQMGRDVDVLLLEKAFGTKTEPNCYLGCPDLLLGGWIETLYGSDLTTTINKQLASKGITLTI